eukprot:6200181-Pleurochrysis_carterae.AAC.1
MPEHGHECSRKSDLETRLYSRHARKEGGNRQYDITGRKAERHDQIQGSNQRSRQYYRQSQKQGLE